MRRGDLWFVVGKGDYAEKPRPYLVLQRSDAIRKDGSVTMMPLTGELSESGLIRVRIDPDEKNGLNKPSDIMVDKIQTMKSIRLTKKIGEVSPEIIEHTLQKLRFWLEM